MISDNKLDQHFTFKKKKEGDKNHSSAGIAGGWAHSKGPKPYRICMACVCVSTPQKWRSTTLCLSLSFQLKQESHARKKKNLIWKSSGKDDPQELIFSHLFLLFPSMLLFHANDYELLYLKRGRLQQVRSPFVLDCRNCWGFHTCNSDMDQGETSLCAAMMFLTNALTLRSPFPFELGFASQTWRKKRKEKNKTARTKRKAVKYN